MTTKKQPKETPEEQAEEAPEKQPAKHPAKEPKETPTKQPAEAPKEQSEEASAKQPEEIPAQPSEEAPKKQPKERSFVDAKTGKAIEHPHQGGSGAQATKAARDEMHAERKGSALPFRIGAIVLWALGVVSEVLAILTMNGTLFLPGFPKTTWLIIWLVIDLVLVVIGSQLWKKANHLAPASKENKLAYWVQTDLGIIIAAVAFAPIILLMLTNKDLDKNTKQIGTIVAGVALVAAVASGIDYHPTTQEDLNEAQAGAAVLSDNGLAYWTPFGEVYHFNPDCQYIKNSATIYAGSVSDALEAKRTRGCSSCTEEGGSDVLANANPQAVAAALENVIRVGDTPSTNTEPEKQEALPQAA